MNTNMNTNMNTDININTDSHHQHTICFVLGGPGSGKGTICQEMVSEMGFQHISLGDLIRDYMKQNPESPRTAKYQNIIAQGLCIPSQDATEFLLEQTQEIFTDTSKPNKLLIDGYPRTMEQLDIFNKLSPIPFCHKKTYSNMFLLYVDTPKEVMMERMTKRGRDFIDGNVEIMEKRFDFYYNETMPVIDHLQDNISHQVITLDGKLHPQHNQYYLRGFFNCFHFVTHYHLRQHRKSSTNLMLLDNATTKTEEDDKVANPKVESVATDSVDMKANTKADTKENKRTQKKINYI